MTNNNNTRRPPVRRKKKRRSGMELSVAIVIINVLIAVVLIVLCVLIYMHLNGQLEAENKEEEVQGSVTAITTVAPEETEPVSGSAEDTGDDFSMDDEPSIDTDEPSELTTDSSGNSAPVDAYTSTSYEEGFYDNSLFIGDSIATGLVGYGYLDSKNVFAQVGLNPDSVFSSTDDNGDTAITKAASMQPDKVFIMLGSNGLAFLGTSYMSEKIAALVDELSEQCPATNIYVISITPVTKAHEAEGNETMADINEYNSLLESVCSDKGVAYIDLCSHFVDAEGYFASTYAEIDGLHFLGTAYVEMLNFIYSKIV